MLEFPSHIDVIMCYKVRITGSIWSSVLNSRTCIILPTACIIINFMCKGFLQEDVGIGDEFQDLGFKGPGGC